VIDIQNEYPKFAMIENISVANYHNILEIQFYKTISYHKHYHAYQVTETSSKAVINIKDLKSIYTEILRCNTYEK